MGSEVTPGALLFPPTRLAKYLRRCCDEVDEVLLLLRDMEDGEFTVCIFLLL